MKSCIYCKNNIQIEFRVLSKKSHGDVLSFCSPSCYYAENFPTIENFTYTYNKTILPYLIKNNIKSTVNDEKKLTIKKFRSYSENVLKSTKVNNEEYILIDSDSNV